MCIHTCSSWTHLLVYVLMFWRHLSLGLLLHSLHFSCARTDYMKEIPFWWLSRMNNQTDVETLWSVSCGEVPHSCVTSCGQRGVMEGWEECHTVPTWHNSFCSILKICQSKGTHSKSFILFYFIICWVWYVSQELWFALWFCFCRFQTLSAVLPNPKKVKWKSKRSTQQCAFGEQETMRRKADFGESLIIAVVSLITFGR